MFQLATVVKAYKKEKKDIAGVALPQEVEVVYLQNVKRRIVEVPNYKQMFINGMQVNEKAQKLMYLKPSDEWLPQNTKIIWRFRGKEFSGEVKLTKAKGEIVNGFDKEVYIQSDNE